MGPVDTAYKRSPCKTFSAILFVSLVLDSGFGFAEGENVYEHVVSSVLDVSAVLPSSDNGAPRIISRGSGVVVDQNRVVTNCHVLAGALHFNIEVDQELTFGRLHAVNLDADLCILDVPDLQSLSVAPVRLASATPRVGSRVYAVGSPSGLTGTLTEGIVSAVRTWDLVGLGFNETVSVVQTSAPITFGSSGGGLFDSNGTLIGIVTFMLGRDGNLNFAIGAEEIRRTLRDSARSGKELMSRLNAFRDVYVALEFDESLIWMNTRKQERWQERFNVFALSTALDLERFLQDSTTVDNYPYRFLEVADLILSQPETPVNHKNSDSGALLQYSHVHAQTWAAHARALEPSAPEPWIMLARVERVTGGQEEKIQELLGEAFERRASMKHWKYFDDFRLELCMAGMTSLAGKWVEEWGDPVLRMDRPCRQWEMN